MRTRLHRLMAVPLLRRLAFHAHRLGSQLDVHFFRSLTIGLILVLVVATAIVAIVEKSFSPQSLFQSFSWAFQTVLGQGDAGYTTSPVGSMIGWLLALFGVGLLAAMTGALVGFVIEFLLKEGQGMGAAGYSDHIVVCGWNPTARELIDELRSDDYQAKVVLLHDVDRNPAGAGVYFVRGDGSNVEDLERAGIRQAMAAIVCPADNSNDADMHSILTVLTIESIAPDVRTVAEVNNPKHVDHFKRADVDEVLVTSRLTSRLLARTALYPGLGEMVTDIVSGGDGSELYRVKLPEEYAGLPAGQVASKLKESHDATLLAVARDGLTTTNPDLDFTIELGDDAVVIAHTLGSLTPLKPALDTVSQD